MKNLKIVSIIMAIVMLFSFATIASAATDGSITIKNAVDGQIYAIYELFELESFDGDNYCYVIAEGDTWYKFFTEGAGKDYVEIDDGMITWVDGKDAAKLAPLAIKYAEDNQIAPTESATKKAGEDLVFSGLGLGYYLVDSTVGTLCSLDTTDNTAEIDEKNEVPTIIKEVKEDTTGAWGERNDAAVGEKVEFKATITVAAGTAELIMKDTMAAGFIFNDDVVVMNGATKVNDYNLNKSATDCTFAVEFDGDYVKSLAANTTLVVTYSATVDTDAVIASTGNTNEAKLVYGEKKNLETTPADTTTTFVWEFEVFKYSLKNTQKTALAGATFSLFTDEACANAVKFANVATNEYQNKADGTVTTFTTDAATGKIKLTGLDSGVYYLKETSAPAGYNKLAKAVKVEIDDKGNIKQDDAAATIVEIENKTGSLLPTTGGIGTYLFYIIGGILVLAAVVLLVTKKRMSKTQ